MSEVFSVLLHNRQRYEQGKEGLWFSLPTTTEKLQEALREIGISADNPQDFFLYDYRSPQERPVKLPRDLVLSADVDELNFLAARLEKLDAAELAELNAALTSPQSDFHSIGQIIDYPDNMEYFVHLPGVQPVREAALVEYYADVLADGDVVAVCVLPENADLSAVAPKLPENERDRRGLARAVFANEPERRAHRHGQRQVLQRKAAEGFGQILNFQCVHRISFQYFRL